MVLRPRFSNNQIAQLQRFGLKKEQIAALAATLISISTILTIMGTRAPLRDVMGELIRLRDTLVAGSDAVERMQNPSQMSGLREAQTRIAVAEQEEGGSPGSLGRAHDAMAEALTLVGLAIAELPKEARRHRTADPRPVRMIDKALAQGWAVAYRGTAMPPLPDKQLPSNSANSTFRKVVGICYEAAGSTKVDPERAIKNYLALRKRKRETRRTVQIVELRRSKKKPIMGRKTERKLNVPS